MKTIQVLYWVLLFFSASVFSQNNRTNTTLYKNKKGQIINIAQLEALKKEIVSTFQKRDIPVRVSEEFTTSTTQNDTLIKNYTFKIIQIDDGENNKPTGLMPDFGDQLLGKKLPDGSLITLENSNFTFSDTKKPTVVNFWFTRCKPCIEEIPILNYYQEKYKDKINFIAITFDDEARVTDFLNRIPFNYKHLVNAKSYTDKLGINFYPTFLYLDKTGTVTYNSGNIPFARNEDKSIPVENKIFEERLERLLLQVD